MLLAGSLLTISFGMQIGLALTSEPCVMGDILRIMLMGCCTKPDPRLHTVLKSHQRRGSRCQLLSSSGQHEEQALDQKSIGSDADTTPVKGMHWQRWCRRDPIHKHTLIHE